MKKKISDWPRASGNSRKNVCMYIRGAQQIFSKRPHDGYQNTQNFMLISKMQTYLCDKCTRNELWTKNNRQKILYSVYFNKKVVFCLKNVFVFIHNVSYK
jgi:hypothetical protein